MSGYYKPPVPGQRPNYEYHPQNPSSGSPAPSNYMYPPPPPRHPQQQAGAGYSAYPPQYSNAYPNNYYPRNSNGPPPSYNYHNSNANQGPRPAPVRSPGGNPHITRMIYPPPPPPPAHNQRQAYNPPRNPPPPPLPPGPPPPPQNHNYPTHVQPPLPPAPAPKEEPKADTSSSSGEKAKPQIMVGKRRRGGKLLPTGVVKKQKNEDDSEGQKDPWSQYLNEVRKYKQHSCDEDSKNRPLVK